MKYMILLLIKDILSNYIISADNLRHDLQRILNDIDQSITLETYL